MYHSQSTFDVITRFIEIHKQSEGAETVNPYDREIIDEISPYSW